ncbi:glycoside hydrolase family 26 protein [Kineococcus sp. SYSU DK004]|uniref:hypothetical protein n=1 Tax=Kineococcus sp. SYSU DK004 TaxID=3383125 RepID=UPI003D7E9A27
MALTHPVTAAASAPVPSGAPPRTSDTWLSFTVSGQDAATRVYSSGVPGGGRLVSYWQAPGLEGAADSRRLTLTVDEEVVAARTASLADGAMTPAADPDETVDTDTDGSSTTITVTSDSTADELYLLPVSAPAAADEEDQGVLDELWSDVLDLIGASRSSASDENSSRGDSAVTAPPASDPSPTAERPDPDSSSDDDVCPVPESDSTPDPAPTGAGDEVGDSAFDESAGQDQADDYAVSDGPSAAPSFSRATREDAETTAEPCGDRPDDAPSVAPSTGTQRPDLAPGDWESGAAGDPEGIAALRGGRPAEIATTWANGGTTGINVPQLQDGGEYSEENWDASLIVSVSPFEEGGSWAQAAVGAYDADWRQQLTNVKEGWGEREGNLYLSPAWELNGNWFPWAVTKAETADFHTAWGRYRELQQEILPDALLTLTFNRESNGYDGDARDLIPIGEIDAYGVDYYNHFPYASTAAEFEEQLDDRDGGGGPKGFSAHRAAAAEAGVPVIVPEWNGSAKNGDSPAFVAGMYEQFRAHAGPGAGQVAAESLFEIDKDGGNWTLLDGTKMPQSAATYARLWGQSADSALLEQQQ